jgi:hypothetical protein
MYLIFSCLYIKADSSPFFASLFQLCVPGFLQTA